MRDVILLAKHWTKLKWCLSDSLVCVRVFFLFCFKIETLLEFRLDRRYSSKLQLVLLFFLLTFSLLVFKHHEISFTFIIKF